ncbi:hypothetical protein RA263_14620 [Pseudomonas syringae pv. tagetis]|uniref:Uncharacterized protein n=1 Tax=Pseudomonas syringae pv. tagetis TaxID=129140 RepID=A0ABW7NM29_9PSED|nr:MULTISPECIES: hypothetical protein [Pseudomonas syringae group]MBI6727687.1 hypothetical protein [Pseudomonas amygdali]MBI6810726.1 hypothetical protein [Pseudomonas amygdali]MDG6439133.1 hypothetical protein [Pseudomonas syringae pv. actinidiae]RMW08808.1 hypothetical protein ALO98_200422 [Pseudomonas syringae pv. tagetis]UNB70273.1 hypothetical protein MME58_08645 [Pseudomonas syringae pv. tagetis]
MLEYQNLSPETRERVEELAREKQYSLDEALEEILIETIAMGGLTFAARPKATLTSIKGGPKGDHLIRTSATDPL